MSNPTTNSMVLTAHGLPHVMGYQATKSGDRHPAPLGPLGLIDSAAEFGLAGIEIPLPSPDKLPPDALRDALATQKQRLVLDYGGVLERTPEEIRAFLKTAAALGSPVVRAILSHILCGDRRVLGEAWDDYLARTGARLNEVLPYAEELGVCIALENHQDATSDDLLCLAEMTGHSPSFGVTLDTGNPLAVGEGPVEYARKIAPLIRHMHLKDYTIHFAPEGYRLVRCAAGDGVVDFPAILDIVRNNGHAVLPGIEVGAQATRTVPLLEPGWWACYPPTPTTRLISALQILWAQGRTQGEAYSSAWERGEDSATVSAEEWDIVRRSVEYFRRITG